MVFVLHSNLVPYGSTSGQYFPVQLSPTVSKGLFVRARLQRSCLTQISFGKISMRSYENGRGCRELGSYNRDLGDRDENFPLWTLKPGEPNETFWQDSIAFAAQRLKWHNFSLGCTPTSEVCKFALLMKSQGVRWSRTMQLYGTILVLFLEFSSRATGLKFPT